MKPKTILLWIVLFLSPAALGNNAGDDTDALLIAATYIGDGNGTIYRGYGTNPLDDKKDTANTPVFAEEPPTPPVDPEEPKTPDPGQPEDTAITAADNVPKTSDNTDIASWLTVVGTALCGLIASIFMSKRQQQKMKRDQ